MALTENIAVTHPVEAYRGARHETTVHVLLNRLDSIVQLGCGRITKLHEAPHTPDGVRLTDAPVTCRPCREGHIIH